MLLLPRLAASIAVLLASCGASSNDYFLQQWPDETNESIPLYIGLSMSFSGDLDSSGTVPGVQVALNQINSDPYMLPGYTLHYTLSDSMNTIKTAGTKGKAFQYFVEINNSGSDYYSNSRLYSVQNCDRTTSLDVFFKQIAAKPVKVAWIGAGCSVATEPVAETSHYFNITQISCHSSSSALANRKKFQYYFQMLVTQNVYADGFFGVVREFGWRKVTIFEQDENLFTVTTKALKAFLRNNDIDYELSHFETEDGIAGLGPRPFANGGRIYILAMYSPYARDLLCEAHHHGVRYPQYLLLTLGWYDSGWWMVEEGEEDTLSCSQAEREAVLDNTLIVWQDNFVTNFSTVADSGITGYEFEELYSEQAKVLNASLVNEDVKPNEYGQVCYDGTWALAIALNKTITELKTDYELNRKAANASDPRLPDGVNFTMEHFTYSNGIVAKTMFKHYQNTSFQGILGHVSFNSEGIREGTFLRVQRYTKMEDGSLARVDVGRVLDVVGQNITLVCPSGDCSEVVWEGGPVPYDGIPVEEIVTVHVSLTVVYSLLATAGIIFAIVCLVFITVFRNKKLIRISSPKLNYIIVAGAIMLYVVVYLSVIPTTNKEALSVLCNITPWLTSLGYSLCFGTILAKMARVYYIFTNPSTTKTTLRDWKLALVVVALVVVDLVILGIYTIVEGARGNLGAKKIENKENPTDTRGELGIEYEYYFYTCMSTSRDITLGLLYGYKGVLQVVSLLFAFQIRKVQVKGLNDAMFIAATIYVTSIILAVTIVSIYSLVELVNVYPVVLGLGLLVGSTAILVLVFVPKMVGLYQDPNGESIFKTQTHSVDNQLDSAPSTDLVDRLRKRIVELENSKSSDQLQWTGVGTTSADTEIAPQTAGYAQPTLSDALQEDTTL